MKKFVIGIGLVGIGYVIGCVQSYFAFDAICKEDGIRIGMFGSEYLDDKE